MTHVALNDGTELPVTWCGVSNGTLSMQTAEPMSISQAVETMTTERMARVVFVYGEMQDIHEGFTAMIAANVDGDSGRITLSFRKGT